MLHAFVLPYQALSKLTHPALRRFVLIPLLINIALFSLAIWATLHYFENVLDSFLPADSWLDWLRWLVWPLFAVAWAITVFYLFTVTANLIGAPFNGILAARAELLITGRTPPETPQSGVRAIPAALISEAGKLWYLVSRAIPVLVLFLVPGVNLIALPLWIALGCWFLALEYTDYPMANHGIEGRAQRQALAARRVYGLAFGAGVMTMTMIPVLNFLAMPAAVIAATQLWQSRFAAAKPRP